MFAVAVLRSWAAVLLQPLLCVETIPEVFCITFFFPSGKLFLSACPTDSLGGFIDIRMTQLHLKQEGEQ